MIQLRPYQDQIAVGVYNSWHAGHRNVLAVAPTGSGKTVIMSKISKDVDGPAAAIAHRQELVAQISIAMARMDIHHNIIAAPNVVKFCVAQHVQELGTSFYHHAAPFAVGGVDTLIRRKDDLLQWSNRVRQWTIDEAHHVLQINKWGTAVAMFPNAFGLGFTATPTRCDGKSLHVSQGGVFSDMVMGPSMRDLINMGYLCEHQIYGPPQSMNPDNLTIGATGEYTGPSLRKEARRSTITGDIVKNYLRIAPGKRAIAFVVDIEQAIKTAEAFRAAGIRAEAVSSKTPDHVRVALVEKFGRGDIDVLVNVDLFGEGFDVPAVEVVIMGRPTQSYGLYIQQFGRVLRIIMGKLYGIVIDHVGNVVRHGLPDAEREWSLLNVERSKRGERDPSVMPVTTCVSCFRAFEAVTAICPHCDHVQEPESRGHPKFIDGDLIEFSPELLAQLRGEITQIDMDCPIEATDARTGAMRKNWISRQDVQTELRKAISLWAGIRKTVMGMDDSEIYRRFYHMFAIDVMSAQGLGTVKANKLLEQIRGNY